MVIINWRIEIRFVLRIKGSAGRDVPHCPHRYHLTQALSPNAPARAVSTATSTLRRVTHPFPPSREGDAESIVFFCSSDILTLFLMVNTWLIYPLRQVLPEWRGGFTPSLRLRFASVRIRLLRHS